jgi:hypothetical protein
MLHFRAPVSMEMWEPLSERRLAFSTEAPRSPLRTAAPTFRYYPVRREATGFRLALCLAGMTES